MAKYMTLNEAMAAGDALAEAEIRYRLLAEAFTELPQLRSNLNGQLERAKTEIIRLRGLKERDKPRSAVVVPFHASRFQKTKKEG
ncbi:hypothetical protein TPB0596_31060 [Tsukamurella pulmonis]|uniref:hypothetical protein n=1 Tax=Tsukamurella pulmonis TaxID=47312 RepID=UPI001EE0F710|nr:hypothetical protein [Tsukamurella pulmonis]BDD83343.1 hypothetical protein TPB0596_31060 [Tsukamurella pulmonis]